jgi:protein-S-isoprenylcysteine O-methyltransferase Ste14
MVGEVKGASVDGLGAILEPANFEAEIHIGKVYFTGLRKGMNVGIFSMIYVICAALSFLIRLSFMMGIGVRETKRGSRLDQFLIFMIVISMISPLVYILTSLLDFANYSLPDAFAWFGVLLIAGSLIFLWRSHADLGTNFALTPSVKGKQSLIKQGIYRRIRHPMYASLWLWAFSMPLLLQNYIVGFMFLIVFSAFYLERVPLEEKIMKDKFGEEYNDYVLETGRVIPKIR